MILMIDDDEDTLEIYQLLIEKTPYSDHFITYNDALEALHWLKELASNQEVFPKYILLDLNMPELNGIEFVHQFEQELNYQELNTEIIILTSSVREKDQQEALSHSSVSKFVSKPLSKDQLVGFLASSVSS
uniref:Response regulator n=1 Tax=Roseihalotalea indica TaxID=2867963 RepID=A0AA49GNH0_9BACT|nr:response regulator [Tunicatimonas sp. TK19036]